MAKVRRRAISSVVEGFMGSLPAASWVARPAEAKLSGGA
jgi:hypothetical protein